MLAFTLISFLLAQEPPQPPSFRDFLQGQEDTLQKKNEADKEEDDFWREFEEKTPNIQGNIVVLRALDKITGRTHDFELPLDKPETFRKLKIIARHCEKTPPEEMPETYVFLQIYDPVPEKNEHEDTSLQTQVTTNSEVQTHRKTTELTTPDGQPRKGQEALPAFLSMQDQTALFDNRKFRLIFSGWMFASNPGLNALEHPVYDIWPIACKTSEPDKTEGAE